MSLEGFLIHGAVLLYVCMCLSEKTIVPVWNKIWKPAVFLVIWSIPVYIFDHVFFVNYGFLYEASYGSPLAGIQEQYGAAGYFAAYGGIILAFLILFYLAYSLIKFMRFRAGKRS
jgi:hypothetical protein